MTSKKMKLAYISDYNTSKETFEKMKKSLFNE
jgi:hypothetical protein